MSDAAALALHATAMLATQPDRSMTAEAIAGGLAVSRNHLAKVLQRLGKAGLVRSTRGPAGGFVLARDAEQVTLAEIYEAMEGPLSAETCLLGKAVCPAGRCLFHRLVGTVHDLVQERLNKTTLADLARFFKKVR